MKRYLPFLAVMLTLLSCNGKEVEEAKEIIKPVKYEQLGYTGVTESHTFSGVVKAKSETNLSFKVGGSLSSLKVKLGDNVKKGTLIATVDPVDYNLQKDQALAQAKSAESQLISARSSFERVEKLYENNSVSLSEYEKAKTNLASAESQLTAAESQLNVAANQIAYTRMYAPSNGIITAINAEINEVVQAGRAIFVMSSEYDDDMEVQLGIPEKYIKDVKSGAAVKVSISTLEETFDGVVSEVAYSSSNTGVTYPVSILLDTKDQKTIRPDMPAEVSFVFREADEQPYLIAPLKAVASGVDGNFVFKLQATDQEGVYTAQKVLVELGHITELGYVIKNGLSLGDLVAVAGLRSLYDGRKVKLIENK